MSFNPRDPDEIKGLILALILVVIVVGSVINSFD
jgi:hypothetical protein